MSSARPTNVVSARRRLVGAAARAVGDVVIDVPTATSAAWRRLERRIVVEDRGSSRRSSVLGSSPSSSAEHVPGVGVGAKRVGLPARPVQGEHQLSAQPLAEGSAGDRGVELGDELGVAAHRQQGVETVLGDRRPQLLPPTRRGDRGRHVGELDQRPTAPQTERAGRSSRRPTSARPSPSAARPSRTSRSNRRASTSSSATSSRYPGGRVTIRSAPSALRTLNTTTWRAFAGCCRSCSAHRSSISRSAGVTTRGPQREQGEERALTEPDERDRLTTLVAHVERAEQTDLHDQKLPASQVAHPPPFCLLQIAQGGI